MRPRASHTALCAFLLLLGVLGARAAHADGLALEPAVSFNTGAAPCSVTLADLDRDGSLDLVTADHDSSAVTVLLGDGMGGFSGRMEYTCGACPADVVAADLDHDGHLDIAVANGLSDSVTVLRGDGHGHGRFVPTTEHAVEGMPCAIAACDLNGDGDEDLVTADELAGSVSVLLGDGAGNLGPATAYAAAADPVAIAVADLDGDAHQDVIVADASRDGVAVLRGDGRGGLSAPVTHPAGASPCAVAVADLDGDGAKDLVVADFDDDTVGVLLGDGRGGFAAPVSFAAGGGPCSLAIADLDGDGAKDLAVADYFDGAVGVLLGDGHGGFAAPTQYAAGQRPVSIAAGALRRDGREGIVVADYDGNAVSVLAQPLATFVITPSVIAGRGVIVPATPQIVEYGATPRFRFVPDAGYHVGQVTLDETPVVLDARDRFVFPPVTADHTIRVAFSENVSPVLGTPNCPRRVTREQRFTVWGSLRPQATPGSRSVTVTVYVRLGRTWSARRAFQAVNSDDGSASRYAAVITLTRRGLYRFRASAAATPSTAMARSRFSDTLSVQ